METWEIVARERIRDSLATYNWSGDAFRLEELAEAFCEDGVLELRGGPRLEGRAAIVEFLSGVRGSPGDPQPTPPPSDESSPRRIVRHHPDRLPEVGVQLLEQRQHVTSAGGVEVPRRLVG